MHGRTDVIARTKRRPRMISSCSAFAVRRYGTVLWIVGGLLHSRTVCFRCHSYLDRLDLGFLDTTTLTIWLCRHIKTQPKSIQKELSK